MALPVVRKLIEALSFFPSFNPSPTACVIEPHKGPWTNSTNWGNSLQGPMPKSEGNVQSVFETADIPGAPRVLVVNLFRSDVQPSGGTFNAQIRARITYGIGAKQNEFDCDWTQGAQFALVANYVRVNAVSYAPSALLPYDVGAGATAAQPITLGAGIALGNAAKHDGLSFTYPLDELSNVGPSHALYDVPDFATTLFFNATKNTGLPLAVADCRIVMFSGAVQLQEWDGVRAQDFMSGGLRIPGGTTQVKVLNTGAAPILLAPQFGLSL